MNQEQEKGPKAIPYGIGSYEEIRKRNFYYVDKTSYLGDLERAGMYLMFNRPRRFGKTLFISMMETYYDINKTEMFDDYFKGTEIYKNPTAEKNAYLILKFDFSEIVPSYAQVEESFFNHVKDSVKFFLAKYKDQLNIDYPETLKELMERNNPSDLLSSLLTLCRIANQKVYLFIDEYDNFANTILSTSGIGDYESFTHGEGFFRAFFNVVKSGTSGSDVPVVRLFLTGVSPITLDDVTSGFNIGENVSIDHAFNDMLGFSESEVIELLDYHKQFGSIPADSSELLGLMNRWYNNYCFSKEAKGSVYNPTLVFYFLKEYLKNGQIPSNLIDRNVRTDYLKLKHLIMVDSQGAQKLNGNFSRLKEVIEKGYVVSAIEKGFPVKQLTRPENFISLLFYFGLLTIDKAEHAGKMRLTIPNETVKKLFYQYVSEAYRDTGIFNLDLDEYSRLMEGMAFKGKWKPLFEYISKKMYSSTSLRDFISGEKTVQAFCHVYLGLSDLFIVSSEKELGKGYADIVLEPFVAKYDNIKYSYLLEIKYMKSSQKQNEETLAKHIASATEQLQRYSLDRNFQKGTANTQLIKLVLVFAGPSLIHLDQIH